MTPAHFTSNQRSGVPYLARFSRDMGYHGSQRAPLKVMKIADNLRLCPSTSTHAKLGHRPKICHPERSRGTCSFTFGLNEASACPAFATNIQEK